ncbi:MAG: hypothetical protein AB1918_05665, partial [Pseudomonadota bacterium]
WRGLSGRSYGFIYAPMLARAPHAAGVYLLAAHGGGLPLPLFVGEAEDIAATLAASAPLLASAHGLGLTHLHSFAADPVSRARIRADLVHGLRPPLNGAAARVLPPDAPAASPATTARPGWGKELLLSGDPAPLKH